MKAATVSLVLLDDHPEIADLAATQKGLITLAQVDRLGIDRGVIGRAIVAKEAWSYFAPGVIQVSMVPDSSWLPSYAFWLTFAPELTASERLAGSVLAVGAASLAAHVWGVIGDSSACFIPTDTDAKLPTHKGYRIIQRSLTAAEWTVHDGMPVTLPLASFVETLLEPWQDQQDAAFLIEEALESGLITKQELETALDPYREDLGIQLAGASIVEHYDLMIQNRRG